MLVTTSSSSAHAGGFLRQRRSPNELHSHEAAPGQHRGSPSPQAGIFTATATLFLRHVADWHTEPACPADPFVKGSPFRVQRKQVLMSVCHSLHHPRCYAFGAISFAMLSRTITAELRLKALLLGSRCCDASIYRTGLGTVVLANIGKMGSPCLRCRKGHH